MNPNSVWGAASLVAGGEILLRRTSGALLITFNRPAKHNAFTDGMYSTLVQLCRETSQDPDVRVVVFQGEGGRAFAAGNDIASFRDFTTGEEGVAYEAKIRTVLTAIGDLPQVTIAAVQGICVGGGLAVANACDLRVATADAYFGYPIARTLGNVLSGTLVLRCAAVFGDSLTREMLLASRLIDAHRAYSAGAVASVVPADGLDNEVASFIEGILRGAPLTIKLTKDQLRDGVPAVDQAKDDARLGQAYASPNFREGVQAFLSKKAPDFR